MDIDLTRRFRATRVVLGVLVALSIVNAVDQAATHLAAVRRGEAAFGVLKVIVALTGAIALSRIVAAPRRALGWLVPWALCVAVLAGMAPVVFGGAPLLTGLLSFGGSACALVAVLVWWRAVTVRARAAPLTPAAAALAPGNSGST